MWRVGGDLHLASDESGPPDRMIVSRYLNAFHKGTCHIDCCSAIGGIAPTPGLTKPMNAISGFVGAIMLRIVASDAVGYE